MECQWQPKLQGRIPPIPRRPQDTGGMHSGEQAVLPVLRHLQSRTTP